MTKALTLLFLFVPICFAAAKRPPLPAEYGKFETLGPSAPNGGLSPDGKWLVYLVNRSNRDNEIRVANVSTGETKTAAFGTQPAFSSDSHWLAYSLGYSETQEDKFRKDKKRSEKKLELLNLATGDRTVVDGVETFAFSPNGKYLAMRHYPPEKKDPAPADPVDVFADEPAPAATLVIRDLAAGRDTAFGNISEYVWQDLKREGHLLALTVSTGEKAGNGIQLYDPANGLLRVLDSSASLYSRLAWRAKTADLAVLRATTNEAHQGSSQVALAWTGLDAASSPPHVYDPAKDPKFPAGMRIVSYRALSWSDNGNRLFLGLAKWEAALPKPPEDKKPKDAEESPTVDIWHWRDLEVMPKQKLSAKDDRTKNLLAVWNVGDNILTPLQQSSSEQVTLIKHRQLAYVTDWSSYAMDRTIGRPAADLYLQDIASGSRIKLKDKIADDHSIQASPAGKYLLYIQDGNYWTIDTTTHAVKNITATLKTSFVDLESDFTVRQKPAFGIAGWTKNDESVILYDRFDLWQTKPDGSGATRLTSGAPDRVRHRYVKLDPDEECIDTSNPIYLSLFGTVTKKSGYARLSAGQTEPLIFQDKNITRLGKAKYADVYSYAAENFDETPNIRVGDAALSSAKQLSATNPFQPDFSWGHGQLIEYKNSRGQALQGSLYYPADYQPGKKYPMVVYIYEKLSDGLHRFIAPSERDYYNAAAIVSHGYFLLEPDILFQPREPGISVADCVGAAVKKALETAAIDPAKIGVVGHSWGGFDTTFLATHTKLFAAAVAGAPITDLVSNYGNHHWSSGIAETDHIETGQQRMEVPLWEDLPAYIRNSAVFNVQNMTTPLMIEVGDSDGTVFFHQGVELYNVARRAGKNVVLLVYSGEDHGLRKKPNQIDYQQRIFAWFDHYLKDEPAPSWIVEGKTYLDRQRELSELKNKR